MRRVMVIGSGGREHALARAIARSSEVDTCFVAPGNAGTAIEAKCANVPDVKPSDTAEIVQAVKRLEISLAVIGPEQPLVDGLADALRDEGIRVVGPTKQAAQMEASKTYAKGLMSQHNIPTARSRSFTDPRKAKAYVESAAPPLVIKADGLAAGKGVVVARTMDQAMRAIDAMMVNREFGPAGDTVLVEDCLTGDELSILALTDGRAIVPLPSAQDHKPVYDDDKGPNTGGMGAYSPAALATNRLMDTIVRDILVPTVHGLRTRELDYRGVVYAGLMITKGGPRVLEYNVRFGDPETQPILSRLTSDILPVLEAIADGRLFELSEVESSTAGLEFDPRPAVTVVMTSGGYPGSYKTGHVIEGLDDANAMDDVIVYHAGTALKDEKIVTAGGRVLGVTALGETLEAARTRAYEAVGKIHFQDAHYRKDIGARAKRR